jgi:hypothetical protein
MPQPYEKPGAKRKHKSPPWKWKETYWELDESDTSDCICAQYSVYKLSGIVPGTQDVPEVDADTVNPSVVTWLNEQGFKASDPIPCGKGAPKQCACGPQTSKRCAVVYQSAEGVMIHIAVFDPEFCDWGGKLSARGHIVRFANPDDYCTSFGDQSLENMQMVFYCSDKETTVVTDEAIAAGLKNLKKKPVKKKVSKKVAPKVLTPVEEPVPDEFGLFPTLRKIFGHWFGLLISGIILLLLVLFLWQQG